MKSNSELIDPELITTELPNGDIDFTRPTGEQRVIGKVALVQTPYGPVIEGSPQHKLVQDMAKNPDAQK